MFRYTLQHILIPEIVENDDFPKPETSCTHNYFLKINSDISQLGIINNFSYRNHPFYRLADLTAYTFVSHYFAQYPLNSLQALYVCLFHATRLFRLFNSTHICPIIFTLSFLKIEAGFMD